jgi:hypothetical protein
MELIVHSNLHKRTLSMSKTFVDLAMLNGVDLTQSLWRVFWADVAEITVFWAPENTTGELDDLIDHMWARITHGERPYRVHLALHHLLLTLAGLDKNEHYETLLMLYTETIKLPRVQDRVSTLAFLTKVEQIRDAFELSDVASVRNAVSAYIDLLIPNDHAL